MGARLSKLATASTFTPLLAKSMLASTMEAIVQKRVRTADPYPWEDGAERIDSIIPSVVPASWSSSSTASVADADATRTVDANDRVASATSIRETKADDLLRYLLSEAAYKSNIPPPQRQVDTDRDTGPEAASSGVGRQRRESSDESKESPPPPPTSHSPILFESILGLFPSPQTEVSAQDIVRAVATKVNAADVPSEMDATQLVLAALTFLSTPISGLGTKNMDGSSGSSGSNDYYGNALVREVFPCLPLLDRTDMTIRAINRCYRLSSSLSSSSDWSVKDAKVRQKLGNLEIAFLSSTLAYPARYRLCPKICSAVEESEILMTGFVAPSPSSDDAGAPGAKTASPGTKGKSSSASAAATSSNSSATGNKGTKRKADDAGESAGQQLQQ